MLPDRADDASGNIEIRKFSEFGGILHSSVYTFFEKAYIVELNADVETGNSKFEIR